MRNALKKIAVISLFLASLSNANGSTMCLPEGFTFAEDLSYTKGLHCVASNSQRFFLLTEELNWIEELTFKNDKVVTGKLCGTEISMHEINFDVYSINRKTLELSGKNKSQYICKLTNDVKIMQLAKEFLISSLSKNKL